MTDAEVGDAILNCCAKIDVMEQNLANHSDHPFYEALMMELIALTKQALSLGRDLVITVYRK